ncbi:MAG: hypothetical protein HYV41_04790, partial [Candidatus Magasanikbacteria bacterium]|nr:hypothetical protein [Candidatus Magasanikbacteria bacterium]MBI2437026.1 hypothetical protein [Candidatus Magasanikbacteria bacterium]
MKTFFDILITLGIFITAIPASILVYSRIKRTSSWEAHHPQTSITIAS